MRLDDGQCGNLRVAESRLKDEFTLKQLELGVAEQIELAFVEFRVAKDAGPDRIDLEKARDYVFAWLHYPGQNQANDRNAHKQREQAES